MNSRKISCGVAILLAVCAACFTLLSRDRSRPLGSLEKSGDGHTHDLDEWPPIIPVLTTNSDIPFIGPFPWDCTGDGPHRQQDDLIGTQLQVRSMQEAERAIEVIRLNGHSNIQSLFLQRCTPTVDLIDEVKRCVNLRLLVMPLTSDDNHVKDLHALKHLESLYLTSSNITSKGLQHVGRCNSLKLLCLSGTRPGVGAISSISGLKNLKNLHLDSTLLERREFQGITRERFPVLSVLDVSYNGSHIDDDLVRDILANNGRDIRLRPP